MEHVEIIMEHVETHVGLYRPLENSTVSFEIVCGLNIRKQGVASSLNTSVRMLHVRKQDVVSNLLGSIIRVHVRKQGVISQYCLSLCLLHM